MCFYLRRQLLKQQQEQVERERQQQQDRVYFSFVSFLAFMSRICFVVLFVTSAS